MPLNAPNQRGRSFQIDSAKVPLREDRLRPLGLRINPCKRSFLDVINDLTNDLTVALSLTRDNRQARHHRMQGLRRFRLNFRFNSNLKARLVPEHSHTICDM